MLILKKYKVLKRVSKIIEAISKVCQQLNRENIKSTFPPSLAKLKLFMHGLSLNNKESLSSFLKIVLL